jgi:hypothetical protein
VLTATPRVFWTSNQYEVAPAEAFQMYVGIVVVIVPMGLTVVGAAGGEGTTLEFTVIVRAALQALVPTLFVALTNQLYMAPFESTAAGITEHVPVPAPQPAAAAE